MAISGFFLRAANAVVTWLVALALLIAGTFSAYALWDNNTIYAAAENVQLEMIRLKPVVEVTGEGGASFAELLAINPDVRAWLSLDKTSIDHPILQGASNLSYINTDVYGNFALAGSIFLDTRSDGSFNDPYSLVYGHDMVEGKMFGDLSLYKDEQFFAKNSSGTLILPDRSYKLKIYAALIVQASDDMIFNPDLHKDGLADLIGFAEKNALHLRAELTEGLKQAADKGLQILALSTCSAEFTDARTIILAVMEPSIPLEKEEQA